MAGSRTRGRRGDPKGKAYGFRGLKPASKCGHSSGSKSTKSASKASSSKSS
jgi:hypothetical protein